MEMLTKKELDVYRKESKPVWIKAICARGEPSGWGLAGTRAAISQDVTLTVLWYENYGLDWVAYSDCPKKEEN